MLKYIILGFLMEGSQNGYAIKQHLSQGPSNFQNASYGSLYPALKRLAEKGFLSVEEVVDKGRFTKVYTITVSGKKDFLDWLKVPAQLSAKPHNHVTKLYFYDYLDDDTKSQHYKYYIECAKGLRQKLIDVIPAAKEIAGYDRQQTVYYGIKYYENIIEFYNALIKGGFDINKHTK